MKARVINASVGLMMMSLILFSQLALGQPATSPIDGKPPLGLGGQISQYLPKAVLYGSLAGATAAHSWPSANAGMILGAALLGVSVGYLSDTLVAREFRLLEESNQKRRGEGSVRPRSLRLVRIAASTTYGIATSAACGSMIGAVGHLLHVLRH